MGAELLKMNKELLVRDTVAREAIEWIFNPPQAIVTYKRTLRETNPIDPESTIWTSEQTNPD